MKAKSGVLVMLTIGAALTGSILWAASTDYEKSRWNPIHFEPAISKASNDQCLECHREILDRQTLERSPAGVDATEVLAWYQTLETYQGPQETMHRRHLVTPLARELMSMKCSTCHQGHDPREEAPIPPTRQDAGFTLRKAVNPKTCLMCHGQFGYELMALPDHWNNVREAFGNSCLTCHAAIRTNRHQVNFLKADTIEAKGKENSDFCFGCHGGRAWYRISYPYPRHAWPGMPDTPPDWAKNRPTESEERFRKSE